LFQITPGDEKGGDRWKDFKNPYMKDATGPGKIEK
jgi:hypothetical protein